MRQGLLGPYYTSHSVSGRSPTNSIVAGEGPCEILRYISRYFPVAFTATSIRRRRRRRRFRLGYIYPSVRNYKEHYCLYQYPEAP